MSLQRAEIVLRAHGRFDLRATVLSSGEHGLPPYRWREGSRPVLERAEQLPDGSVHLLALRPAHGGVLLQVAGEHAREIEVLAPLAARARRALGLDHDLADFQRACDRDPLLRPARGLGLGRRLRGTSVFEDVVKALVSNDTDGGGTRSVTRLVALGPRCPARPALRAFPSPAALARLGVRRLRDRAGLGDRAGLVSAFAREVAAGRHDLLALDELTRKEAARALRSVRGLDTVAVARLLLLLGHHDQTVLDRVTRSFARRTLGADGVALHGWLRRHAPADGLALWCAQWLETPAARRLATTSRRFRTRPTLASRRRQAARS